MVKLRNVLFSAITSMAIAIVFHAVSFAYEIGNTISFGQYPFGAAGTTMPIQWQVVEKFSDGSYLLVSNNVIDSIKYNAMRSNVIWANSTLRIWLNSNFYNTAFSDTDKRKIVTSTVQESGNSRYKTETGNSTQDNVFILSEDEMLRYFPNKSQRAVQPTPYAVSKGVSSGAAWYWMRSPGSSSKLASLVTPSGKLDIDGVFVNQKQGGVRVALRMNPNILEKKSEETTIAKANNKQYEEQNTRRRRKTNSADIEVEEVLLSDKTPVKTPTKKLQKSDSLLVNIPVSKIKNPDAIAVIIGVKNYENNVPEVQFALEDANAVRNFVEKAMGYSKENIIYVEDPTKGKMEEIFGNALDYKAMLYDYVKPGKSDVFVYYTGHGAPDQENRTAYFVPKEANPDYIRHSGYSMSTLYENLAKLPARKITVVTDACFSGQTGEGKMIIRNASPLAVSAKIPTTNSSNGKMNVFNASRDTEMASWYTEKNHSLFTYYFLLGLSGAADKDNNKNITTGELNAYLQENVSYWAKRLYHRNQNPMFIGTDSDSIAVFK